MKQGEPDRFGGVAAQRRTRRCRAAVTRRLLLAALVLGVPGWNFAWGQAAVPGRDRPARIGILLSNAHIFAPAEHPVFVGLREVGWLDGQNATLILRDAEGQSGRLPELAADLVAAKPDVIITAGPQAVQAVKNATTTIPVVFAIISDPVTYGVVASLAHPGGNLTGLSMVNTVLSSKRLELLREVAPGIARVAVFTDPTMGPQGLPETRAAAASLGLDLQVLNTTPTELERAFADAQQGRAQALLIMPTPFFNVREIRQQLAERSLRQKLPSMCEEVAYVHDGCLLSYGPDFVEMWRRSAAYVDKILKGAKPADLPIEQPTKYSLFVNLKTANALGLIIPPAILARAEEVIE
jgi:putative ABC transport system substrate-binding protein